MTLRPVLALQDQPGFVDAFTRVVAQSAGYVCAVCGLQRMGHAPESEWLGYASHEWTPRAASAADLARADELTSAAYRNRPSRCGHAWPRYPQCHDNCPHIGGHCDSCGIVRRSA